MRFLVFLMTCFCFLSLAQAELGTVQISDSKDAAGNWAGWTDVSGTWVETPVNEIGPHNPMDTDALQDWYFPDGLQFWHFWFRRTMLGTYALRWCRGAADSVSVWSPVVECTIIGPGAPRHR